MKHYIIIEVRERSDAQKGEYADYILDAGIIRKAIHEVVKERGLNAADAIIREDREWLHPLMQEAGCPRERNPYQMAKAVFVKAMGPRWRKFKEEQNGEIAWDRKWQV